MKGPRETQQFVENKDRLAHIRAHPQWNYAVSSPGCNLIDQQPQRSDSSHDTLS